MGNSGEQQRKPCSQFPIQNYLNRGLDRAEVVGIRKIFDSLQPKGEVVRTAALESKFSGSNEIEYFKSRTGKRSELSFDQLFDILCDNMNDKKRQYKNNVTFESEAQHVECLLCPYPEDRN